MTATSLTEQIVLKQSYLCVGLDSDITKLPAHLKGNPDGVLAFNKAIIDATLPYCVSYKINTAFYEALGLKGWEIMKETLDYIPQTHFTIADAKRGDIGNTSSQYAKAFFEALNFDAITVALLGGSTATGVLMAGLLFGAFKAGSSAIQIEGISPDVLGIVQGAIVLFIAAPPLIRAIFRLPPPQTTSMLSALKSKLFSRGAKK
jgi:hypothetical protein